MYGEGGQACSGCWDEDVFCDRGVTTFVCCPYLTLGAVLPVSWALIAVVCVVLKERTAFAYVFVTVVVLHDGVELLDHVVVFGADACLFHACSNLCLT